jgi:seryl-tRNA synthetase
MPLDINLFRAHAGGNPELIRESQRRRFASVELVDEIIAKDELWRRYTGDIDDLKKNRNIVQKQVAVHKKAKTECDDLLAQIKSIGEEIIATENKQSELKKTIDNMIRTVGNIVDNSVPIGNDEDLHNVVVRKWGNCRDPAGTLNHHDLLWRIGGYEPERGSGVAGHRGYFLKDVGVLLNQAFINYSVSFLRKRQYSILQPPYMMKKEIMAGIAQLAQFDEELYKVSGGDGEDKYLIATSEQPICAYHMNEWMDEKQFPIRYSGVSTCFRKEAGSGGKDNWGIFRVHQFEKVEQFAIVECNLEESQKMQDEMINTAEEFYQSLGFPYHVINIASGALNNAATKKLDLECWFPGYDSYRELVSCSNCTDYQSRSLEIRSGQNKKMGDREKKYVHMLNATLCATGRAICCLLETYQEADGVRIPEVLVPFMDGMTFMPFIREAKPMPGAPKEKSAPKDKVETVTKAPEVVKNVAPTIPVVDVSPEEALLLDGINKKGDEIRFIKAAKGDKDAVKALVDQLMALKVEYKEKTGKNFGGKADAPAKEKKDEKKKNDSSKKVKAAPVEIIYAQAPAIPIEPPAYTTPAPIANVTVRITPVSQVLSSGSVEQVSLEERLKTYSYVGGYVPSKDDSRAFNLLQENKINLDDSVFPNITRWARNVMSYSEADRNSWQERA